MAFILAALVCFLGAVFSWMRGAGQSQVFHTMGEDIEEGIAGAGEIAMGEIGVGSPGALLEPGDWTSADQDQPGEQLTR